MPKLYRYLSVLIIIVVSSAGFVSYHLIPSAMAQDGFQTGTSAQSPNIGNPIDQLTQSLGNARISYRTDTGNVHFIGTDAGKSLHQPSILPNEASPEDAAMLFLSVYGEIFGMDDPGIELIVRTVEPASGDRNYVRYQQEYRGVPVIGGELVVQLDSKLDVLSVNGELLPKVAMSTSPDIDSTQAAVAALDIVSKVYRIPLEAIYTNEPELWIYSPEIMGEPGGGSNHLVWRMEVTTAELLPIREFVLVDAHTGEIILNFNQLDSLKNREVYDHNNIAGIALPGTSPVRSEGQAASGVNDVDRAYEYSGNTYDFYLENHARDSLDGLGMKVISTVRYCPSCPSQTFSNAFWNGVQMVYGNGFAAADDVVAHELTHGVTENESNLFYYMQSGAINESFSDIWGEFVDLTYDGPYDNDDPSVRWNMGEDVPGLGAIRSMSNPPAFNDPDRMGSPLYYCATGDNGGVHTNSGVGNKAAYLMVDGGTFNGFTITGIGIPKVAQIFYETQAHMLTSASDYQDLAESLSQACNSLIGTSGITMNNCQQVREAIAAVEMTKQPISCAATEAPLCDNHGFDSQFGSSLTGWSSTSGVWFHDTSGYALTYGEPSSFSSIQYATQGFGDYEFTATMRRYGCATCSNGLQLRGKPLPLQYENRWEKDYAFLYNRSGEISVWKRISGIDVALLDWTFSEAVNLGDAWNTLRVVTRGNTFFYYVNNHLIWSGTDNDYRYGMVGLTMYRDAGSTSNLLQVDSAVLKGGSPLVLFTDSFEHGLEHWGTGAANGSDEWYHEYSYATGDNYELYGYDQGVKSDIYAYLKNSVALPPGQNAYLRFRHAYDMEASFDGGVIEYSTNGGGTWLDAGGFVLENGYNGTLSSGYENPLGGRSAFTSDSKGYKSTRLNLSSLAGLNFLFRFRMGTDISNSDLGWFVDEFQLYSCLNRVEQIFLPPIIRGLPPTSFNYPFTDSSSGWQVVSGAWRVNDGYYASEGIPNSSASVSNWQSFADLDYEVRMQRYGCPGCPNSLFIRGDPELQGSGHHWNNGYLFQYTNDGYISVWKFVNGVPSAVLPWVTTASVAHDEANTIRVIASGTNLSYYLNGELVWSGSDASLSTGYVGFGFDRDDYSSDNWLEVDYATLTSGTAITTALGGPALDQHQLQFTGGNSDAHP